MRCLPLFLLALALPLVRANDARAQARGGTAAPAPPRAAAPIDLTGQWVAVISEDWRWRMITPAKGDIVSIPLNLQGQHVAEAWDPAKDEAAGEQCKAYGAPGLMRGPIRMRISWLDDNTLKVETDYGMQTRLLRFANAAAQPGPRSWQGATAAEWIVRGGGRGSPRFGTLKTVTTNLRAGVLAEERRPLQRAGGVHGIPGTCTRCRTGTSCWSTRTWSKTRPTSSSRSRRRSTTSSNGTPASGIRRHATRDSDALTGVAEVRGSPTRSRIRWTSGGGSSCC